MRGDHVTEPVTTVLERTSGSLWGLLHSAFGFSLVIAIELGKFLCY